MNAIIAMQKEHWLNHNEQPPSWENQSNFNQTNDEPFHPLQKINHFITISQKEKMGKGYYKPERDFEF